MIGGYPAQLEGPRRYTTLCPAIEDYFGACSKIVRLSLFPSTLHIHGPSHTLYLTRAQMIGPTPLDYILLLVEPPERSLLQVRLFQLTQLIG